MTKHRSFILTTSIVAITLLAMSGACSQHEPGTYQGGGRTEPTSVIGPASGGPTGSDSSTQDTNIPEIIVPDNSVPDTFTGG